VGALGRVGRGHELARSAAPEAATPPELFGLGHVRRLAERPSHGRVNEGLVPIHNKNI
jgi:hypothetical protein